VKLRTESLNQNSGIEHRPGNFGNLPRAHRAYGLFHRLATSILSCKFVEEINSPAVGRTTVFCGLPGCAAAVGFWSELIIQDTGEYLVSILDLGAAR
jgi:hypothetical protein